MQSVRIQHRGHGTPRERGREKAPARVARLAAQARAQHDGIRPLERFHRRGLELLQERRFDGQNIGQAGARGGDGFFGGHELHEPRPGGERGARGVQGGARHPIGAAHHAHAAAIAFMHRGLEPRQPRRGPRVGHEHRPGGIGRREADVHDHQGAAPFTGEQVAAARAAEGHRELGADGTVRLATREIEPRRTVEREHGRAVPRQPVGEREDVALGGARRSGAQQGVHGDRGLRPRLVTRQLPHAVHARQRAVVDGVVRFGIERGDPDRHARGVERAGEDPAVAAVVPRPGRDEHAARHRRRPLADEHLRRGPARRLHEDATGNAVLGARQRVPRGRLGGRQHRHRVHGINTPPYPTTCESSPDTHPECR